MSSIDSLFANFHPDMDLRVTTQDLRLVLLEHRDIFLWYGEEYVVNSKHLGAGIYSLKAAKRKPSRLDDTPPG